MGSIAIIDSGVDTLHPRLKNCRFRGCSFVHTKDGIVREDSFEDTFGHGTAVAAIIHKTLPEEKLYIVKTSSTEGGLNEKLLCAAIDWCIKEENIRIINISLGIDTNSPPAELFELCRKAYDKGIYICASNNNLPDRETYPAYFPGVFGVTTGLVKNKSVYKFLESEYPINVLAKGTTQRLAWSNQSFKITSGSSFATAHFTTILGNLILSRPRITREEVIRCLEIGSDNNIEILQHFGDKNEVPVNELPDEEEGNKVFNIQNYFTGVNKIALFPASEKEMGTILNFRDHIPYEITTLYDYPRSFKKNDSHGRNEIMDRIAEEDFTKFDTLVIGYFLDQLFDNNIKYGYDLIRLGFKSNKNFVVWDRFVYQYLNAQKKLPENESYSGTIYMHAIVDETFQRVNAFRFLPETKSIVLMVVGTSNKQGKITAQMQLKKILSGEGYKVSHLSTGPQGGILGAEFVFPYGHESTVYLPSNRWSVFLPTVLKGIGKYNSPHIILTGTQGKFLPRSKSKTELRDPSLLNSLNYYRSIQPDGVIIAVNPEDSIELIKNVIHEVTSFSNTRILFGIMTPWERTFLRLKSGKVLPQKNIWTTKHTVKERRKYRMPLIFL